MSVFLPVSYFSILFWSTEKWKSGYFYVNIHLGIDRDSVRECLSIKKRPERVLSQSWKCDTIHADGHSLCYSQVTIKCFSFSHPLWHKFLPFCYRKLWSVNGDAPSILNLQVLRLSSASRDALHPSLQKIKRIPVIKLLKNKNQKIGGCSLKKSNRISKNKEFLFREYFKCLCRQKY